MHLACIAIIFLFSLMYSQSFTYVIKEYTSGCQHLSPNNQSSSWLIKNNMQTKYICILMNLCYD